MATDARINITAKDKTKAALGSVRSSLKSVNSAVFSVQGAVASLAGAAGFGALISSSLKTIDSLGKTADKLGTTTEALAGMRLAAERTAGVTSQTLDTALQRMVRRVSEASIGTGTAVAALKELGLEAGKMAAQRPDEQFASIADAMQSVASQGDRVRLSMALFDTEGVGLANTLRYGSEGLAEYAAQAQEFGLALSRIDAAKIEAANDSIADVGSAVSGIANQVTIALAPALDDVAQRMVGLATNIDGVAQTTDSAIKFIIQAFTATQEAINVLAGAFNLFGAAVNGAFSLLTGAIANYFAFLGEMVAKIPFIGESLATPFMAVSEAAETFSLITGDAFLKFGEEALINSELMGTYTEAGIAYYEGLATAAVASTNTQVAAMKRVSLSMKKELDANGKWLAKEAKAKDKADKEKAKSTEQYTNAAMTLGNALFEDNKAVKAGLIIADTAAGIMKAFADLPYPAALAASASIAATGVAQLAAARSASKGGGSAPSVGGGGGGSAAGAGDPSPVLSEQGPATPTQTSNVSISLSGGLYSRDDIRELIESINAEIGEGATLLAT